MSNKFRNNYPLEFRISSVNLAESSNQPVSYTARDLGIKPDTLYSWIAKYSTKNNQDHMGNNVNSVEEIKRLKKELFLVKQERDLLKKAAAYFAKTSQ